MWLISDEDSPFGLQVASVLCAHVTSYLCKNGERERERNGEGEE